MHDAALVMMQSKKRLPIPAQRSPADHAPFHASGSTALEFLRPVLIELQPLHRVGSPKLRHDEAPR